MQHPGRIANATGIHGHLNDLVFHLLGLARVRLVQKKRASTIRAHTAPIPLLPFWRRAMPNDIGPLAIWTVQHLGNHSASPSHAWVSLPF